MLWKNKLYRVVLARTKRGGEGADFVYTSTKANREERVRRAIQRAVAEHPETDAFGWKVVSA